MRFRTTLPLLATIALFGAFAGPGPTLTPDLAASAARAPATTGAGHASPLLAERAPDCAPDAPGERAWGDGRGPGARALRPPPAHDRASPLRRLPPARGRHAGFLAHPPTAPPRES